MPVEVHPVTPDRWDDMVTLFEQRGPRGGHRNTPAYGCWCMYWRDRALEHGEPKKRAMRALVRDGCEPGLLAYADGEPVGWVSVAPRETFRLKGAPAGPGEVVWSISCFFVPRDRRREGLSRELIAGAVAHAKKNGATVVEAYPVDPDSPSYRHMGFIPVFAAAGFADLGMTGKRRHVMRFSIAATA